MIFIRFIFFFFLFTYSFTTYAEFYGSPYSNSTAYGALPSNAYAAPIRDVPIGPGPAPAYPDMNYYYQGGYYSDHNSIFSYFMPDQIVLEPYIYAHYNLSAPMYTSKSGIDYNSIYSNTIPGGFGVAIGLRANNIFLAEFDITGAKNKENFNIGGQNYSQNTNFVFLRFNLGIAIPLSVSHRPRGRSIMEEMILSHHDRKLSILIMGGFITTIRDSVVNPSSPAGLIGTTVGVLPEVGGGIEYWFNHRFGLRTTVRYAFSGTDQVLKGLLTFDIGAQVKL